MSWVSSRGRVSENRNLIVEPISSIPEYTAVLRMDFPGETAPIFRNEFMPFRIKGGSYLVFLI